MANINEAGPAARRTSKNNSASRVASPTWNEATQLAGCRPGGSSPANPDLLVAPRISAHGSQPVPAEAVHLKGVPLRRRAGFALPHGPAPLRWGPDGRKVRTKARGSQLGGSVRQAGRIGVRSSEGPVACRRLLPFGRSGAAPWPGESIPPPKNGVASRPLEAMLPPARAQLDRGRDTITWRYNRTVAMHPKIRSAAGSVWALQAAFIENASVRVSSSDDDRRSA
jgi:hypothetical protein